MTRPEAQTLVLEENGVIAAFLLMELHPRHRTATLVTLDVLSEFRRKGYASKLMSQSQQILLASGIRQYTLQVDTLNEGAVAFYRRWGFEVQGRLPNYYPGDRDAWQMIKILPTNGAE